MQHPTLLLAFAGTLSTGMAAANTLAVQTTIRVDSMLSTNAFAAESGAADPETASFLVPTAFLDTTRFTDPVIAPDAALAIAPVPIPLPPAFSLGAAGLAGVGLLGLVKHYARAHGRRAVG